MNPFFRRKKLKEMAEGAQRRSARLLAIEELKTDKAILALPVDFQQMKDNRKRGRKKTIEVHEVITCILSMDLRTM